LWPGAPKRSSPRRRGSCPCPRHFRSTPLDSRLRGNDDRRRCEVPISVPPGSRSLRLPLRWNPQRRSGRFGFAGWGRMGPRIPRRHLATGPFRTHRCVLRRTAPPHAQRAPAGYRQFPQSDRERAGPPRARASRRSPERLQEEEKRRVNGKCPGLPHYDARHGADQQLGRASDPLRGDRPARHPRYTRSTRPPLVRTPLDRHGHMRHAGTLSI